MTSHQHEPDDARRLDVTAIRLGDLMTMDDAYVLLAVELLIGEYIARKADARRHEGGA